MDAATTGGVKKGRTTAHSKASPTVPQAAGDAKEVEELRKQLEERSRENERLNRNMERLMEEMSGLRVLMQINGEEARKREVAAREEVVKLREDLRRERMERENMATLLATFIEGAGQSPSAGQQQVANDAGLNHSARKRQHQQQRREQQLKEQQLKEQQLKEQQRQQQQQLLNQRWQQQLQSDFPPLPESSEGGTWAEVTRSKPRSQNQQQQQQGARPKQQQQRQQQQTQQRPQRQQQQSQQQQRAQQLQQEKRRPPKRRPDEILVVPVGEVGYLEMYTAIRESPLLQPFQRQIGVGKRTPSNHLRLQLAADTDSAMLCAKINEAVTGKGTARVVAEMSEVVISDIDPLATEDTLRKAILDRLEKEALVATITMWIRFDGTQRAKVRLPRTEAEHLIDGRRMLVHYSSCPIREAPKLPAASERCYRCLERGHRARTCTGVDRSNVCVRCGEQSLKAASCKNEVKCLAYGGRHRFAAAECRGEYVDGYHPNQPKQQ
uniref:CCHC-type domain-containing protein n=1 Tax=Anopheles maculatus TaxID=74869 RepID=A0A182SN71_9DIPT